MPKKTIYAEMITFYQNDYFLPK